MSLYAFGKQVVNCFFHIVYRVKVEGRETIPKGQNYIICANHKSNLDPPLVGLCMPFPVRFMAKEELFHNKLVGSVLTMVGAFPIKRGKSDVGAMRTALKLAKDGEHVVIFPEGGRSHQDSMRKGKMGAAMIAVKSGVNILPVGVDGAYRPFGKLTVRIGKPIDLSQYFGRKVESAQLQEITDQMLMPAIAELARVKTYENRNSG